MKELLAVLPAVACVIAGVNVLNDRPRTDRKIPWTAITLFSAAVSLYIRRGTAPKL
jgi:hypothetical protein